MVRLTWDESMELDGLQSVASAVDRLVTTYQDGRKLVDEIKERRRARDAAQARPAVEGPDDIFSQDLEEALLRAKDGIQSRYDRDFKRHGEEFATGDKSAVDTLKDIVSHLQRQVISHLETAWAQDTHVDFLPLQDVTDSSQDRAILCLVQLHQRLLAQPAPTDSIKNASTRPISPLPGLAQGFIDPASPPTAVVTVFADTRSLGNVVTISGGGEKKKRLFSSPFRRSSRHENNYRPRTNTLPTRTTNQQHLTGSNFLEPPARADTMRERAYLEDSPTLSPERMSSVSSLSSIDTMDRHREHSSYITWSGIRNDTPPSSYTDSSISPVSNKDPMMPDALLPRRYRDSQSPSHSPHISSQEFPPKQEAKPERQESFSGPPPTPPPKSWISEEPIVKATMDSSHVSDALRPRAEPNKYQSSTSTRSSATSTASGPRKPGGYTWLPPSAAQRSYKRTASQSRSREVSPPAPPPPPPRVPLKAPNRPKPQSPSLESSPATPTFPLPPLQKAQSQPQPAPRPQPQIQPPPPPPTQHILRRSTTRASIISSQPSINPSAPIKFTPAQLASGTRSFLPAEPNKFAGFCKGAWRLQIGDRKKAYEDRMRPAGLAGKMNAFYKCTKCNFEGRCLKDPQGKKTIDTKIYGNANGIGILYRWEFLFKCHVPTKDIISSPFECHFGCIFCCAEGKGTPIFSGFGALLAHLTEHRGPGKEPTGEVLYRIHCALGTSLPAPTAIFDVAMPALEFQSPDL